MLALDRFQERTECMEETGDSQCMHEQCCAEAALPTEHTVQHDDLRYLLTRNAINVSAAEVSHKDAIDLAMHDLRLLQQLPLGVFSTVKQHHCFLSSDSYAVWAPA